jgi:type VI secretion system protein ImpL
MDTMWRHTLLIGRRILPYLRSAALITLALLVMGLLVATWWLGPRLEIGGDYPLAPWQARALVTLAVVLLMAMIWGMVLARRLGRVNARKVEEKQEEEDPVLPLERRQQRLLDNRLADLKRNLPGRKGVYKLPWYLLVGLEDAGKSSLIQRSGQTYTLTNVTRCARTERNPYGFEWWVGDKGVLIDPDGELLSQDAGQGSAGGEIQQRLWKHFLSWLEKNRPQRPLNGIILTVDLARLCKVKAQQREAQAVLLRTRLRELMEQLGSRLPVYITFTKLDLMYGFGPFARTLSKEEKEEPLGCTFKMEGQQDPDDWLIEFEQSFAALVKRLNARLPDVLAVTRDGEERAAAYSFTRQLAGLKPALEKFLGDLLCADAFSTPALVRGTYFTSVVQEGVPEDAFVSAAADNYGLAEPIQPAQRSGQSASLFTQALLPKVIYREAGLASDNRKVAARRRRGFAVAAVVALASGVGMTAGWQHYFIKNANAAQAVETGVESFINNWRPTGYQPDTTGRNLLEPLDQLREATLAFGDYRSEPAVIADMGLYQGHKVGPEVEASYLDNLAYQFMPALMLGVMEEMGEAPDLSSERLDHLRVLRMLYDASGRRADIVRRYMRDYWQDAFPAQRDLQQQLVSHLDYALAHTDLNARVKTGDATADMALAPFRSSVQWAQQELGSIATPERVYRDLEVEAAQNFRSPLDLARESGPAFSTVFVRLDKNGEALSEGASPEHDPARIPSLLTRKGMDSWFLQKSDSVTELALIDAWVLGRRSDVDFSEADEARLRTELQLIYAEEYANRWREALSHLDIQSFSDLNHGVRILESLTGGHEPLKQLLANVTGNTRLIPAGSEESDAARQVLEQSVHFRMVQNIQRQFTDLNKLLEREGDEPTDLDQVMDVIENLHIYMRNIQESPDRGKAALSAARARMGLQGADPIFTLQRVATNQPAPLNRMLEKLASESWRVVLDQAVGQLERQWYQEVYQPFQQSLARHYPFNQSAGTEAALQDFERFFAPDGLLDRFYADNLKLFLEDHPEQVAGTQRASLVRKDVVRALEEAEEIRRAFFTRSGSLDVEFSLEPLHLSSNKRRSVMNVDGQLVEFSHGPGQSIPLIWPNTLRDSVESRITLVPTEINRSPRSMSEDGPWALFRLLDEADITGVSGSTVDVRFALDRGEMRYRLHAGSNTNPFTQELLAGYQIPRSLY